MIGRTLRTHALGLSLAAALTVTNGAFSQTMDASSRPTVSVATDASTSSPAKSAAESESGPPIEQARVHYERGLQLYDQGAAEPALAEFERAYQLAPSFRLLYNIGRVRHLLHDYAAAILAFEQYLKDGGAEVSEMRQTEVTQTIASLRRTVATVRVEVRPNGAEISVDDVAIGHSPLPTPLTLNPGRRRISAQLVGYLPKTQVINLAGADATTVNFDLKPTAPAHSPKSAPPPPPEQNHLPAVLGWSTTGALTAVTAVVGILALRASANYDDQFAHPIGDPRSLDASRHKVQELALVADLLAAATLAAGGISLYLTLRPSEHAQPERTSSGNGMSLREQASNRAWSRIHISPIGAVIEGSL